MDVFIVGGVAGGGLASIRGGAEFKQNIKAKKGINKIISTLDSKEFNDINRSEERRVKGFFNTPCRFCRQYKMLEGEAIPPVR